MSKFGLTGLGRGGGGRGGAAGARGGRGVSPPGGGGPVFVGTGPAAPKLGGRTFGRGFRFPSNIGPFFSDGSSGGWWPWGCPWYQLPTYPVLPQVGALGKLVNPTVPRYGLSDLSQDGSGLLGTGLFGNNWGMPEIVVVVFGGIVMYSLFFTTKTKAKRGFLALEVKAHKRRKTKAQKYRERAKALEAKGLGGIFA